MDETDVEEEGERESRELGGDDGETGEWEGDGGESGKWERGCSMWRGRWGICWGREDWLRRRWDCLLSSVWRVVFLGVCLPGEAPLNRSNLFAD